MIVEFVRRILVLIAEYDCQDDIFWDEDLNFFVNCNDFFFWGVADAEIINPGDLELFKKSLEEADDFGPLLFVARKRKMRPQNAAYEKIIPSQYHKLFNECGSEREIGFFNP